MKTYRDLQVWQKSMTLVTEIYKISKEFPKDEAYGLTSQMRRCAISIPRQHGRRLWSKFD